MNPVAQAALDCAREIEEYLRTLPPLKLANIPPLVAPARSVTEAEEIVLPIAARLGKTVSFLQLVERRRGRTFSRGEFKGLIR
jgi:hypothetical protein